MDTNDEKFIEQLVSDPKKFCDFVYTPLDVAIDQIKLREKDENLTKHIESLLGKIPLIMQGKPKAVLFRNVVTPNYETKWFADVVSTLEHLDPLFLEYTADKFTNRNECKFALGKLLLYKGNNKKNEPIFESERIININDSNCKPISSISTSHKQSLVDFHHEIFLKDYPHHEDNIHDFSYWVHENGPTAKEYYKLFYVFFIRHGILFENFLLKSGELPFIKEVILPAFIDVYKKTGVKPLITTLEPTEIEEGRFWQAYHCRIKDHLETKRKNI